MIVETTPSAFSQKPADNIVIKHVDAATFQKLSKTLSYVIVDVRTPREFSEGHLVGAQNLDFSGDDFTSSIASLDRTSNYLVYCNNGRRSAMATEQMKDAGFMKITDLKGGITAWKEARLPLAH
ncbi:MAG: rhodanese-like domain-containing protein [Bacteroidota bacterium]